MHAGGSVLAGPRAFELVALSLSLGFGPRMKSHLEERVGSLGREGKGQASREEKTRLNLCSLRERPCSPPKGCATY